MPHSLYGLTTTALHGEPGLFAIFMLRDVNMKQMFSFFIPSNRLQRAIASVPSRAAPSAVRPAPAGSQALLSARHAADPQFQEAASHPRPVQAHLPMLSPAPYAPAASRDDHELVIRRTNTEMQARINSEMQARIASEVNATLARSQPPRPHQQRISGVSTADERVTMVNVPRGAPNSHGPYHPMPVNSSLSVRPYMPQSATALPRSSSASAGSLKMSFGATTCSLTSSLIPSRPDSPPIMEWQQVQIPSKPQLPATMASSAMSNSVDLTKGLVNIAPAQEAEKKTAPLPEVKNILRLPSPSEAAPKIRLSFNPDSPAKQRSIGVTVASPKLSLQRPKALASESLGVVDPVVQESPASSLASISAASGSTTTVTSGPATRDPVPKTAIPRAARKRPSVDLGEEDEPAASPKTRKTELPSTELTDVQKKIVDLEKELQQAKYKEALLVTQAAQLKRMAEENSRLKRENDMLRTMATSQSSGRATPLSSSASSIALESSLRASTEVIAPKRLDPVDRPRQASEPGEFVQLPSNQRYKCCWAGCMHESASKFVLRSHVRVVHLQPLMP